MIGFDELTHFSKHQFFYMLSRNRTDSGVAPYVRATCNPDADSWVADFIKWWITPETGYPIPERSGVIRYMVRLNDEIIWGDSKEELAAQGYDAQDVKSVTFIASTYQTNKEAYSDFQHAKPINPTLEIVKMALVGIFELNIVIIQRGILGGCLFAL